MNFLWPQYLWIMLTVPLLPALYAWLLHRRGKPALRYSNLDVVREASSGRHWRRHVPPALLLIACSLHPAMRFYLDNWKSVKNKPNENQGRELLELHTVGRGAGYTEAMVKDSAKLLSGYTADWGTTFAVTYDPNKHTTGAVQVLDFTHPNASADGQAATLAYLKYLANHPATAKNLARKIATYFVRDDPSTVFRVNVGDINKCSAAGKGVCDCLADS